MLTVIAIPEEKWHIRGPVTLFLCYLQAPMTLSVEGKGQQIFTSWLDFFLFPLQKRFANVVV